MFKFSFNNFSNTISAFNLFNFSINLNKKNAKVQLHPEESVQKEITNNEINKWRDYKTALHGGEISYIGDLKENITIYLFIQKTPTSGAWNLVVPVVKGDESQRFLEFALGSFALQGCGGGLNNTDTLFYYLEKHINKGYNVTILPKVIESTYLDDFQYLDSNVKIETLLENSIDLINYRKGKLDWIFKEYIRLSNKYSLV